MIAGRIAWIYAEDNVPKYSACPRSGKQLARGAAGVTKPIGAARSLAGEAWSSTCLTAGGIASDPGLYRRIWMLDWLALAAAGCLQHPISCAGRSSSDRERATGWRLAVWLLPRLLAAWIVMWGLRAWFVVLLEPPPFNNPQPGNALYALETLVIMCTWSGFYFAYDYYYRRYEAGVVDRLGAWTRRCRRPTIARAESADRPPLSFQQPQYPACAHPE